MAELGTTVARELASRFPQKRYQAYAAEVAHAIDGLADPDPAVRKKAVRWIANEGLGEWWNIRKAWMRNREITALLIRALDDADAEVVENAVVALAMIAGRYFRDDRAYRGMVRQLQSKRRITREWAVQGAVNLRGAKAIDDVLPLLQDRSARVRLGAFGALGTIAHDKRLSSENADRLCDAFLLGLKNPDSEIRLRSACLLGVVGNRKALEELRQALDRERKKKCKESIQIAIDSLAKKF
jgi:HEAT repeat protein